MQISLQHDKMVCTYIIYTFTAEAVNVFVNGTRRVQQFISLTKNCYCHLSQFARPFIGC